MSMQPALQRLAGRSIRFFDVQILLTIVAPYVYTGISKDHIEHI